MAPLRELMRRLGMLIGRSERNRDLQEEMQLHVELLERQQRERGVTASEAGRLARRQFGSPLQLREQSLDAAGWRWLDDFAHDIRFAARSLARHKSFTITAVLTLALGVGANTAIFSIVNGVVLKPLPFRQPDRLVQLYTSSPLTPSNDPTNRGAVGRLSEIRQQSTSFDVLVAYDVGARYLRTDDGTERVMSVRAELPFFDMLGVAPLFGRAFAPGDAPDVAVISEAFWRQRLNGTNAAIGHVIALDDQAFTVIGVMPGSFQFPYAAASLLPGVASASRTDLWLPLSPPSPPQARLGNVTGRLKDGVSLQEASSELALIAERIEAAYPETNRDQTLLLEPLVRTVIGTSVRGPLFVLLGAVGIVLALACANVVNLSLVRTALRAREVCVRAAIGAGRVRLARQFLTESLFLVGLGSAAGLLAGWLSTRALADRLSATTPRAHEVGLDWRVFVFLLTISVLVVLVVGLTPTLAAMRGGDTYNILRQSGEQTTGSLRQRRLRSSLVIAELAFAVILALGATMLVRELVRLRQTNSGMVTANVMTFHVGRRSTGTADVPRFAAILARVRELPDVRTAGFTQLLPLQNWGWNSNATGFTRRGGPPSTDAFSIEMRYVTPGYFETLSIPIRGRSFSANDSVDAPRVVVVNETLARRVFGAANPIGVAMNRGTIVGVAADVRQAGLNREPAPELYFPMEQNWSQLSELGMSLVVRANSAPERLVDPIRSTVRDVEPGMAVFSVKTMDQVVSDSLASFNLFLWLMAAFATVAIVLAVVGAYGVMASTTTARTHEFAIRTALGASRGDVTGLVLKQGVVVTGVGLLLGVGGAWLLAPFLDALPIPVGRLDVITTIPVVIALGIVSLIACVVPARRAGRVDPMAALRDD